jgi:hypothetical protein
MLTFYISLNTDQVVKKALDPGSGSATLHDIVRNMFIFFSVVDPDPDPHVFGPPGSGSTSQRYGSGSFYQHEKIVRKTSIPTT